MLTEPFHCKSGIDRRAGSRGSVSPAQTRRRVTTHTAARIRTKAARKVHSHKRGYNEGAGTHAQSSGAGAQLGTRDIGGRAFPSRGPIRPALLALANHLLNLQIAQTARVFSTYPRSAPNLSTCDAYSSLPLCLVTHPRFGLPLRVIIVTDGSMRALTCYNF